QLMELGCKHDDYSTRNSLHGFIHNLRRHLRHDSAISILNLRGIGYRLVVKSERQADE
ncbi:MAG: winged helix-turn-helix domain-containing protein, partial [Muribaculaceae bacterium]|nr:winged helix-turn-helix domain-containing protein [Muribaculaceae bacterium]